MNQSNEKRSHISYLLCSQNDPNNSASKDIIVPFLNNTNNTPISYGPTFGNHLGDENNNPFFSNIHIQRIPFAVNYDDFNAASVNIKNQPPLIENGTLNQQASQMNNKTKELQMSSSSIKLPTNKPELQRNNHHNSEKNNSVSSSTLPQKTPQIISTPQITSPPNRFKPWPVEGKANLIPQYLKRAEEKPITSVKVTHNFSNLLPETNTFAPSNLSYTQNNIFLPPKTYVQTKSSPISYSTELKPISPDQIPKSNSSTQRKLKKVSNISLPNNISSKNVSSNISHSNHISHLNHVSPSTNLSSSDNVLNNNSPSINHLSSSYLQSQGIPTEFNHRIPVFKNLSVNIDSILVFLTLIYIFLFHFSILKRISQT